MSNILIIDDEKAIRKTLSEILSYEGYKIDEAGDGEEGLKKVKEKEYDVILCDIKMPKIDGIEFLEKAKEIGPDIPIIMISGHGTIETAVEAVKKGAYDISPSRRISTACSSPSATPWIRRPWWRRQRC